MTTISNPKSDDGWIEWNGGGCPVSPGTVVRTRSRDGFEATWTVDGADPAVVWQHLPNTYPEWDIIAYRIVKP